MYTESIGSNNNVPAFLSKLWRLVDSISNNDLISWSPNGKSFIIRNQAKFAKDVLPLYFKHNNMASFIRQLNMYGFRKITHIENTGLKIENDEIEFYHAYFVKGQENMLEYIKRKNSLSVAHTKSTNGVLDEKMNKEEVSLILTDVKGIKDKQDNMDNMLINLQNENEALWKEIASLRHKHQKQQQIVERLIHFLMSLVQSGNIGLKRKAQLMIDSKNGNGASSKVQPSLASMASTLFNSNTGPIIQEITHGLLDDDEVYEADVNSPIINTAQSETSEPAQFDDLNDSPTTTFVHTPNSQTVEISDLKENSGQLVGNSNNADLFDPLQESINAINAEDEQIIDLNAIDTMPVSSPNLVQTSTTTTTTTNQTVQNYPLQSSQQQPQQQKQHKQQNLVIDQQQPITSSSSNVNNSNSLNLVLPNTPIMDNYDSNLVPSTSNVLNTPCITAENFDNHLEGIDTELNSLQDQLMLSNFNIDSNVLMGLFSNEEQQKCIQQINNVPTSSNTMDSYSSKPMIQEHEIESNLNSNFDLCDNYPTAADDLFDNQTGLLDGIDSTIIKQDLNTPPMFDADDLLGGESDINHLLDVNQLNQNDPDLFYKEKKRKRIS